MNMLLVFQQPDRSLRVQLIFVIVQNHRGEPLLLSPSTLPNTVFLVAGVRDVMKATCDVLPDLLLLDARLPELVKCALTQHLGRLFQKRAHRTPLVANVQLEHWQATNRQSEQTSDFSLSTSQLESLLAAAISDHFLPVRRE
jgi:hypothetical protein